MSVFSRQASNRAKIRRDRTERELIDLGAVVRRYSEIREAPKSPESLFLTECNVEVPTFDQKTRSAALKVGEKWLLRDK